jgi:carboxymethylenebutenolidase
VVGLRRHLEDAADRGALERRLKPVNRWGYDRRVVIESGYVDIPVGGRPMRTFVAAPRAEGRYPGIVFYTDIFQLTEPSIRWASRLTGHGFVVAAPEIYYRVEEPGQVLAFDDAGKDRGQADVEKLSAATFDEDIRALLDWLGAHPKVAGSPLGVAGHCTGGHLAFRAALQPDVRATACWYATGLHNGKLGSDADAGSLERAVDIQGELLMVFGARDPHTPAEGLERIKRELDASCVRFDWRIFDAEHAFGRDVGPRWDPQATDEAFAGTVALFRRALDAS